MKKLILSFMFLCLSMTAFAGDGSHHVRGYTRSNGTYVQGHEAGNPGSGVHYHNNVRQ